MAIVELTHPSVNGGSAVRVLCDAILISGSRTLNKTPYINGGLVDVQPVTYNVPSIGLQNIHFTGQSGTLLISDIDTLYTSKVAAILNIKYGTNTDLSVSGVTDINCFVENFSTNLSTSTTKEAYQPSGNLTLVQTE
jgi:hypothetical protein